MNQEKIGKFISECRKNKNMTQQELAEKLGVSDRTIGNWENGRNMPDLSLFKPLCDELDISLNDLMSGEKVNDDKYQEKLEENLIQTINYSNIKENKNNTNLSIILIIIGILISISAMTLFVSDSSWGSIYSVIGVIISSIGVYKITKKFSFFKRLIINGVYFITFMALLLILDYFGVLLNQQAPRFTYEKQTGDNIIVYKNLFYNVYRINYDTKNEYYIVDNKKEYNDETLPISPFNRTKSGIDSIIKYKSYYLGDNSNTVNLINKLPLSEYGFTTQIDSDTLGLTINYHITDWYINENFYLEKSLIYNSVSLFSLIDNLEHITFNFSNKSYKITKDAVEKSYPNYQYITRNEIDKNYFDQYLEKQMNDNEFVNRIFQNLFFNENIINANKIVVKNNEDEIFNTITNMDEINEIINLMQRSTKITGAVNLDGNWWNIYLYNNDELIYKFLVWGYNGYSSCFGIDGKEYKLIGLDGQRFAELLQ